MHLQDPLLPSHRIRCPNHCIRQLFCLSLGFLHLTLFLILGELARVSIQIIILKLIKIIITHWLEDLGSLCCSQVLLGREMSMWLKKNLNRGVQRIVLLELLTTCWEGIYRIQNLEQTLDGILGLTDLDNGTFLDIGTNPIIGMETESGVTGGIELVLKFGLVLNCLTDKYS